jgi:hypothetical protein
LGLADWLVPSKSTDKETIKLAHIKSSWQPEWSKGD